MIVCADDFGLREDIDRAILELCSVRKLSAVSCMVLFERCSPRVLNSLMAFRDELDLGLHLCLTEENLGLSARDGAAPLQFSSYGSCVRSSVRGKVRPEQLANEIAAQYRLFASKCGMPPDYIDGHLHIHQAPAVRKALIRFLLSLPEHKRPYIRNTFLSIKTLRRQKLPWVKAAVIGRFGKEMAARLRSAGLRTNEGFAGIYDFHRSNLFCKYLPRFADCLEKPTSILVVHPGHSDAWRRSEFEALRDFTFEPSPRRFAAAA